MFRSQCLVPLAVAGFLFASLALTGCGGSSPANVVTNPVAPTPTPIAISEPTPTPTPDPIPNPDPTPTPAPTNPAQYGFTGAIIDQSPDFSGHTFGSLMHGSASNIVSGDQDTVSAGFGALSSQNYFEVTLVKTGTIQAGDVIALTPTSASTSRYFENFDTNRQWKADSGSVRVDSVTTNGVYTLSLLNIHYSPDPATPGARGTFVVDGIGDLVFSAVPR